MTSQDITVTDLEQISEGVEGEEHESTECAPVMKTCKYSRGSFVKGDVVVFFRYCRCGKYNKQTCDNNLAQLNNGGINVPTDGLDIHRDSRCYYADPKPIRSKGKTVYVYSLHCVCKHASRTSLYLR